MNPSMHIMKNLGGSICSSQALIFASSQPYQELIRQGTDFLWNNILLFALLGIGIYLSVTLRFPQVRFLFPTMKKMVQAIIRREPAKPGSMTAFQSLATAVASQVGTGNIIGVATAIASGGPGAGFWMLVSAFFGMATIFAESVLAQLHVKTVHGEKVGGPAYYLENGLHSRFLAVSFAILCILALGVVGIMVQGSSVIESVNAAFGVPKAWVAIGLAAIVGFILTGGMNRIAKFSETVVPLMAFIYIFASLVMLLMNLPLLWPTIQAIFLGAFRPQALFGGALGISMQEAVRFGIARGLFSNEAGMGSTPHSHAVADVDHPADQGMVAMIGVFICTFCICLATAMVNLMAGSYQTNIPASEMAKEASLMTQHAFQNSFGTFGGGFLSIALSCFALTTIIGWYFFAENNIKYLFANSKFSFIRKNDKVAIVFARIAALGIILLSTVLEGDFIWTLADLFMGLMAIPNILGLALLHRQSKAVLLDYEAQLAQGAKPTWHGLDKAMALLPEKK